MVKQNLLQFIYMNPAVSEKLRNMSPMVARLFEKRTSS